MTGTWFNIGQVGADGGHYDNTQSSTGTGLPNIGPSSIYSESRIEYGERDYPTPVDYREPDPTPVETLQKQRKERLVQHVGKKRARWM